MRLAAFFKHSARGIALACSIFLVVLVVAACGTSGTTTGTTPTATSQPAPTTTAASTPTTSSALTTYTGNGYSIGYPQGWKVNASGNNVIFSDPTGIYSLTIAVAPNPGGTIDTGSVLNTASQLLTSNFKNTQTVNVPASTTIGGDTWMQKSLAGTATVSGQTGTFQVLVAADNHPANSSSTNAYTITYETLQATFATANSQYFQPMIQSFKFTS